MGGGGGWGGSAFCFYRSNTLPEVSSFESLAISGHWDQHEFLRGTVSCSGHAFVCHLRSQWYCDVDGRHLLLPRITYQL